jgi:hypothetical protein
MAPLVHHFNPCTTYCPLPPLLLLLLPTPLLLLPLLLLPLLLLLFWRVIADVMLVASLLATFQQSIQQQHRTYTRQQLHLTPTPTLHRGSIAPLVHHFSPCTTYSPPPPLLLLLQQLPPLLLLLLLLFWRVIAEVMLVASLLATAFSVMAKQERMWPRSSGSSQVCCCSGVPYLRRQAGTHDHDSISSW